MTQPLRRVLVRPPQAADSVRWREYGWRAEPNLAAAAAEHEALREILEDAGAEVIVSEASGATRTRSTRTTRCSSASAAPCCSARARTSGWASRSARGRPRAGGHPDRRPDRGAGHDRRRRHALARPATLLVGRGYRTNAAGVEQLARCSRTRRCSSYDLPHWNGRAEVMHLISLISPLDEDLALVYPRLAPVRLIELLAERGIRSSRSLTRSSRRWARTCSPSVHGTRSRSRGTT